MQQFKLFIRYIYSVRKKPLKGAVGSESKPPIPLIGIGYGNLQKGLRRCTLENVNEKRLSFNSIRRMAVDVLAPVGNLWLLN